MTIRSAALRSTVTCLAAAAAAPLAAQTSTSQPEIQACYDSRTSSTGTPLGSGIVYRIKVPGVVGQQGCVDPKHTPFSWTIQHGALTGLGNDDHPQYLLVSGARALTGNLNAGGKKITGLGEASAPGDAVRFEQALKTGDAAGGDLAGSYPNATVNRLQGRAVASVQPTDGYVLAFNATTATWEPRPAAAASGTSANTPNTLVQRDANGGFAAGPVSLNQLFVVGASSFGAQVSSDGGFLVMGNASGAIPKTGPGDRLMWHPARAAFRAGRVDGAQWDDANIAFFSAAMGRNTTASGAVSTAMGFSTTASGEASAAMGLGTRASGEASAAMGELTSASGDYSTAMGRSTEASGEASTAMGRSTTASGAVSTAMGTLTTASGRFSTAMGTAANADWDGSFVYGDASSFFATVNAGGANRFVVRASGGTTFYSTADLTMGASLAPGAGAWASVSDVRRKENFRELDGERVLGEVAQLPILEWNYKAQATSIRHLGPTAQDFWAAFGLGESDTTITTTDIDGVNLLAVQALERRTREQAREIEALRAELATLRAEIARRRE